MFDLSQLFDRVAWTPLQGRLQEMRILPELLWFLLRQAAVSSRFTSWPSTIA